MKSPARFGTVDPSDGGAAMPGNALRGESPAAPRVPRAAFGPLQFELLAVTHAFVPGLAFSAYLPAQDVEAGVVSEGGETYLIVDHRAHDDSELPARLEIWCSSAQAEGTAPYLLVLSDSRSGEAVRADSMHESIERLVEAVLETRAETVSRAS